MSASRDRKYEFWETTSRDVSVLRVHGSTVDTDHCDVMVDLRSSAWLEDGLRCGVQTEPAVQVDAAATIGGHVAGGAPSLALSQLAAPANEEVDTAALAFLHTCPVKAAKEEKAEQLVELAEQRKKVEVEEEEEKEEEKKDVDGSGWTARPVGLGFRSVVFFCLLLRSSSRSLLCGSCVVAAALCTSSDSSLSCGVLFAERETVRDGVVELCLHGAQL